MNAVKACQISTQWLWFSNAGISISVYVFEKIIYLF